MLNHLVIDRHIVVYKGTLNKYQFLNNKKANVLMFDNN